MRLAAVLVLALGLAAPGVAQTWQQPQRAPIPQQPQAGVQQPQAGVQQPLTGVDTSAAALLVRMQQMEAQLRSLTGRVEELQFANRQLQTRLERLVGDVDFRLNEIEGQLLDAAPAGADPSGPVRAGEAPAAGAAAPGAAPGPATGATPPRGPVAAGPQTGAGASAGAGGAPGSGAAGAGAPPPQGQLGTLGGRPATAGAAPELIYDRAFGLLRQQQYSEAAQLFDRLMAEHPQHQLVNNACYWRGEIDYVARAYAAATQRFALCYQSQPQGPKAPDNLLKLAMSLKQTNRPQEACATLAELARQFPSAVQVQRAAQDERRSLGCP